MKKNARDQGNSRRDRLRKSVLWKRAAFVQDYMGTSTQREGGTGGGTFYYRGRAIYSLFTHDYENDSGGVICSTVSGVRRVYSRDEIAVTVKM